jgi:SAM-dependent methyltransferase
MSQAFDRQWRARFERFGRSYEDEARVSGWSAAGLRRRLHAFEGLLRDLGPGSGGRALDLGCGAGTYVRVLAGLGHRTVGLDYSLPSLARAVAADPGAKGQYLAGEAYALPFPDTVFDLVVCIGVLQALGRPEAAVGEMARVLRPGGLVVVEALNGRAVLTRLARAGDRLRGRAERVRAYDPATAAGWLAARGLAVVRRQPVWVPPRRLPALAGLLESAPGAALAGHPALAALGAHTFLLAARKP